MDFADFLNQSKQAEHPNLAPFVVTEPAAPEVDPAPAPVGWPIAVYQAIDGAIPGEPFVAYPMVPQKAGKFLAAVRCPGATADEARAAARKWIEDEAAKTRKRKG